MLKLKVSGDNRQPYTVGIISLTMLFLLVCMKWLIEGILDRAILEAVACCLIFAFYFTYKGIKIKRYAVIWLLFIINIFLSILTHDSTIGLWGRGVVTMMITSFILFIDEPLGRYKKLVKIMSFIGFLAACFVSIHFLLQDHFNSFYVPLLNETAAETARLYLRSGYYFGLMYNPHEPAGLIAFTIVALLTWKVINKSKNEVIYLVCIGLAACLLLTGKKAVLLCSVITLLLIVLTLYGSRKQWLRGLFLLALAIILMISFVAFAINHPENPYFNRFSIMFTQFIGGGTVDSGRFLLYERAISEWNNHKILGIGWRHFNALTIEKFHMTQAHEVNCDYLQWLCETGIVGFVLSVIPILFMLYRTVFVTRKLLKNIDNKNEQWPVVMACYIQFFTVIYAFVEIPFFDIVLFTMYIISGIIINSTFIRKDSYL